MTNWKPESKDSLILDYQIYKGHYYTILYSFTIQPTLLYSFVQKIIRERLSGEVSASRSQQNDSNLEPKRQCIDEDGPSLQSIANIYIYINNIRELENFFLFLYFIFSSHLYLNFLIISFFRVFIL